MNQLNCFIANTKRKKLGQIINNKDLIRNNLIDDLLLEFKEKDSIRILTLPSAIWTFEKLLFKKVQKLNKKKHKQKMGQKPAR